jgi:hypothetical protein
MRTNKELQGILESTKKSITWLKQDIADMVETSNLDDLLYKSQKLIEASVEVGVLEKAIKLNQPENFLIGLRENSIERLMRNNSQDNQAVEDRAKIKIIKAILK